VDSVSLVSSVLSLREGATANDRQIAVAASAARSQKTLLDVLLQAIETSAYGSNGKVSSGAVTGTRFSASA
jgi:hypothetical protein